MHKKDIEIRRLKKQLLGLCGVANDLYDAVLYQQHGDGSGCEDWEDIRKDVDVKMENVEGMVCDIQNEYREG